MRRKTQRSIHQRCPGGCCCCCAATTLPGSLLQSLARCSVPLAILGAAATFAWAQVSDQAIVWVGVQLGLEGEMVRSPVVNTTFWESVADGWEQGAYLSQGAAALFTGGWPYLISSLLLVLWFTPRNLRRYTTLMLFCTKWGVWFLTFAFMQALAFQYSVTITFLPGSPLEFFTFLIVDIQATDGAYLIAAGTVALQALGNIVFIADRALAGGVERGWESSATDNDNDCYPLFLTVFWRTARNAEYNGACSRCGSLLWAGICQLLIAGMLLGGGVLTTEALVEDLFTLRQETGITLNIELADQNRTSALLPLTFSIANGALAGPGVMLEFYEELGQLVLSGIFFGILVLFPLALFVALLTVWTIPLTPRYRAAFLNGATLCQSWNCQDLFAIVLLVCLADLKELTAYLANDACADVADLIPGLIAEGKDCLVTGIELNIGTLILGCAAVVQWLSLGVMHRLVAVNDESTAYYVLPKQGVSRPDVGKLSASLLGDGSWDDEVRYSAKHRGGAVWAHDAPEERNSFLRTDDKPSGSAGGRPNKPSALPSPARRGGGGGGGGGRNARGREDDAWLEWSRTEGYGSGNRGGGERSRRDSVNESGLRRGGGGAGSSDGCVLQ